MSEIKTPAQVLRAAADHMEKVGFNQDGHYYAGSDKLPDNQRPCCTIGAIRVVEDDFLTVRNAVTAVGHTLGHRGGLYLHDQVVNWNDRFETTKDEVLATLRATAERLEKQA